MAQIINGKKREACPHCGRMLIDAAGPKEAKILLVGEFPGYEEVRQGRPFVGRTGEVLQQELARQGLQLQQCRYTNLWQHDKAEKACDPDWHLDQLTREFQGRSHVLLMGSDVTTAILGGKVMEYAGTRITLPAFKDIRFWVSPNPAIVFNAPLGELRLAIERFAKDTRR